MKIFSLLSLCTIVGVTTAAANSSTPKVRSIKGAETSSRQLGTGNNSNPNNNGGRPSDYYSSYSGSSSSSGSSHHTKKPPAKKTKKPKAKPHKKTSSHHSSSSSSSSGYSGYSNGYSSSNGYTKSLYSYSAMGILGVVSAAAAVLAKKVRELTIMMFPTLMKSYLFHAYLFLTLYKL